MCWLNSSITEPLDPLKAFWEWNFRFMIALRGKSSPGLQSNRNSALEKEIDIKYFFKLCRKPLHHKTQQKRALESGTKKPERVFREKSRKNYHSAECGWSLELLLASSRAVWWWSLQSWKFKINCKDEGEERASSVVRRNFRRWTVPVRRALVSFESSSTAFRFGFELRQNCEK